MGASANSKEPTQTKRLLAFGDSLTYGYLSCLVERAPYTDKLQTLLKKNGKWELVNAGESGERTGIMVRRLDALLKESSVPFTHIVLLGGSNDLWTTGAPCLGHT